MINTKKPEILLINPQYMDVVYRNRTSAVHPPLGLAYLAAYLETNDIGVEILDANALRMSFSQILTHVNLVQPLLIGITAVTRTIGTVLRLAEALKTRLTTPIVLGGPHTHFTADQILSQNKEIDFIIRGEGELALYDLLCKLKSSDYETITNLSYRLDDEIKHNPDRKLIRDIDSLPFPAWHLLPRHLYRPNPLFSVIKGKEYAKIISSRGCPYKCSFCASSHFWKIVRFRSPENILHEIDFLVNGLSVKSIDFLDDTFTLPKSKLIRVCEGILQNGYRIQWSCYARVESIDTDIAKLMLASGCRFVQFGIESGNQKILDSVDKKLKISNVPIAVKTIQNAGMLCMGDFILGHPEDTYETVMETIRFAKKLKLDAAFFTISTPFPGTKLFDQEKRAGNVPENVDWEDWSAHFTTKFKTKHLSSKQLSDLYSLALRTVYFTPYSIVRIVRRFKLFPDLLFETVKLGAILIRRIFGRI